MLLLDIGDREGFNEETQEFVTVPGTQIELEHSLISVSKWESFYEKPFLTSESTMTYDESVAYIRMMTLTPDVSSELYEKIDSADVEQVGAYIQAKMTATWLNDKPGPTTQSREVITSELVYYWMVALNIPFDPCQSWHLNRLLTLIKVCNQKNQPPKQKKTMTRADLVARSKLNAQRRAETGTRG